MNLTMHMYLYIHVHMYRYMYIHDAAPRGSERLRHSLELAGTTPIRPSLEPGWGS